MRTPLSRRALIGLGAGALALAARPPGAEAAMPDDPVAGRRLIFEDPFTSLDPAIWTAGPKATTNDPGFYGNSAFARRDGEEGIVPYAIIDHPDATDGKALRLSGHYIGRPMSVPGYYGNNDPDFQWISANLQTARRDGSVLRGWRNGYFEARIRFPSHPLSFSAFWLMNGRSILFPKTSVEIDVVEHKGWERSLYGTYLHEWGEPGERHEASGVPTAVDLTAGFHRYGTLIDGARCMMYFERRPLRNPATGRPLDWRIGRADELDRQDDLFWPLLTLGLSNENAKAADASSRRQALDMDVDYVRVYA